MTIAAEQLALFEDKADKLCRDVEAALARALQSPIASKASVAAPHTVPYTVPYTVPSAPEHPSVLESPAALEPGAEPIELVRLDKRLQRKQQQRKLSPDQRFVAAVGLVVVHVCARLLRLGAFTQRADAVGDEIKYVVETTFVWLHDWMRVGHAGANQLPLHGREFLIAWSEDRGLVVRDMEVQKLFQTQRAEVYAGLRVWINNTTVDPATRRLVLTLAQYGTPQPPTGELPALPPGVSEQMYRFLAMAAATRAWALLAQHDRRIPKLLLGYYFSDEPFAVLGQRVGGISAGRVSQLTGEGIAFLLAHLPDEWQRITPEGQLEYVKKTHEFPLPQLRRGRVGRGGEASREAAQEYWATAGADERERRALAVERGMRKSDAGHKISERLKSRAAEDPEFRAQLQENLRRGPAARWGTRATSGQPAESGATSTARIQQPGDEQFLSEFPSISDDDDGDDEHHLLGI